MRVSLMPRLYLLSEVSVKVTEAIKLPSVERGGPPGKGNILGLTMVKLEVKGTLPWLA